MTTTAFFTIIARNYLAYARTLFQTLRLHHPQSRRFVLIVDYFEPAPSTTDELFEVVRLDQLGIDDLMDFTFKYNVTELCTAVKPFVVSFLLKEHGMSSVVYLDPDIYVYRPLDQVFAHLKHSSVVLTPHIMTPYPDDGQLMDEATLLRSGIYNLGFVAFNATDTAHEYLSWWQNRLYEHCLEEQERGYFVDQKWMDFCPAFVPNVAILRHPGYNVAYWNLHERTLKKTGDVWLCNDSPLVFFHFSGLPLTDINSISKYQNRFTLMNRPELRELFEMYGEAVVGNQPGDVTHLRYGYGFAADGTEIDQDVRRYYRSLGPARRERFPAPFSSPSIASIRREMVRARMSALRARAGRVLDRTARRAWRRISAALSSVSRTQR